MPVQNAETDLGGHGGPTGRHCLQQTAGAGDANRGGVLAYGGEQEGGTKPSCKAPRFLLLKRRAPVLTRETDLSGYEGPAGRPHEEEEPTARHASRLVSRPR